MYVLNFEILLYKLEYKLKYVSSLPRVLLGTKSIKTEKEIFIILGIIWIRPVTDTFCSLKIMNQENNTMLISIISEV